MTTLRTRLASAFTGRLPSTDDVETLPTPPARTAASSRWQRGRTMGDTSTRAGLQQRSAHIARNVDAVAHSARMLGAAMGKVRWVPQEIGPDGSRTDSTDPILGRIAGAFNADTTWAQRLGQNLVGPAEAYIALKWQQGLNVTTFSWQECKWESAGKPPRIKTSPADQGQLLADDVELIRVFMPDPEWSGLPWSPLMSEQALAIAENILLVEALRLVQTKSQLNAGILKVPVEIFHSLRPLLIRPDGEPTEDNDLVNRFLEFFEDPAEGNTSDRIVPLLAIGPGDSLSGLEHVEIKPRLPLDEYIKSRDVDLQHLAMLLPVPELVLLGQRESNHWTGALELDTADRLYWQPMADLMAIAITTSWLRPYLERLRALGMWNGDPSSATLGVDTSKLTKRPADWQRDIALLNAGIIAPRVVRSGQGYGDNDAPNPKELAAMAQVLWLKNLANGGVTTDERAQADAALQTPTRPTVDAVRPVPTALTAAAKAPTADKLRDLSVRLHRLDDTLAGKLAGVVESRMADALREAGYRVRKRSTAHPWKAKTANTAPIGTDPTPLLDLPGIVAATDSGADVETAIVAALAMLAVEIETRIEQTQDAMLTDVARTTGADVDKLKSTYGSRLRENREEAAAFLAGVALTSVRSKVLQVGTATDEAVPGITLTSDDYRRTLTLAGGGSPLSSSGGLTPQGTAAGDVTDKIIREAVRFPSPTSVIDGDALPTPSGVLVNGQDAALAKVALAYEWVHDHPRQPFAPHVALNGKRGADWSSFDGFHPGDHRGCKCILRPYWELS